MIGSQQDIESNPSAFGSSPCLGSRTFLIIQERVISTEVALDMHTSTDFVFSQFREPNGVHIPRRTGCTVTAKWRP
jgi:hypothetical protein